MSIKASLCSPDGVLLHDGTQVYGMGGTLRGMEGALDYLETFLNISGATSVPSLEEYAVLPNKVRITFQVVLVMNMVLVTVWKQPFPARKSFTNLVYSTTIWRFSSRRPFCFLMPRCTTNETVLLVDGQTVGLNFDTVVITTYLIVASRAGVLFSVSKVHNAITWWDMFSPAFTLGTAVTFAAELSAVPTMQLLQPPVLTCGFTAHVFQKHYQHFETHQQTFCVLTSCTASCMARQRDTHWSFVLYTGGLDEYVREVLPGEPKDMSPANPYS
jgi:hypothetical protein